LRTARRVVSLLAILDFLVVLTGRIKRHRTKACQNRLDPRQSCLSRREACRSSSAGPAEWGGIYASSETRAGWHLRAWPFWRRDRQQRGAGENPHVVGGPARQLGLDHSGEEGSGSAYGQVLHPRIGTLPGHAADDHGDRQQRTGSI